MPRRWIKEEEEKIKLIRELLCDQFEQQPPFPEVVGDRRILRFVRGRADKPDESVSMFSDFLKWRKENDIDQIRQNIVYGGMNSPYEFPNGRRIIELAPQIVFAPSALDRKGQPIALEQYDFNPKEVFKEVTIEEYMLFLTYCLEFRALALEQMSEERERAYLQAHPDEADREEGYGVVLRDCTIRDLKGVGFAHVSSEGRALVKGALDLGLANYPEFLAKSHMINAPMIFTTMWYFVKGMLDEGTIAKVAFHGANYLESLQKEIPIESIPACLGGKYEPYNEAFEFDTREGVGALYYPGAPSSSPISNCVSTALVACSSGNVAGIDDDSAVASATFVGRAAAADDDDDDNDDETRVSSSSTTRGTELDNRQNGEECDGVTGIIEDSTVSRNEDAQKQHI